MAGLVSGSVSSRIAMTVMCWSSLVQAGSMSELYMRTSPGVVRNAPRAVHCARCRIRSSLLVVWVLWLKLCHAIAA